MQTFSQFEERAVPGLPSDVLWEHSLCVASTAKHLAEGEPVGRDVAEGAFVGGLLHDVGKLILSVNFPKDYQEALSGVDDMRGLLASELSMFGVTHADVGGYLLGLWGLPAPV